MSEEILKTDIVKEKGCLYFCKERDGFVTVNKSKAGRPTGWRKDKSKVSIKSPEANGMSGHAALTDEEIIDIAKKAEAEMLIA